MGQLSIPMEKCETESPIPHTTHQNELHVDYRPRYKRQNYKVSTRDIKECLYDLGVNKDFLNRIQNSISIKNKIHRFNYIKIRNFCSLKDIIKRIKRHAIEWEKILTSATHSPDKTDIQIQLTLEQHGFELRRSTYTRCDQTI